MVNESPNTWSERRLRLCIRLSIRFLLALHLSPDYVFPDIIILAKVEELSDLRCTLGTEAFGDDGVRQSGNFVLALFNDNEGKHGNIGAHNASTHGFALALTGTADTVTRVTIGEEKADTVRKKDTLLHRKTLLVVSTCNAENVTLPFITKRVSGHFL